MSLRPFHLAVPSVDLHADEDFYCRYLDARVGRRSERWTDIDLFGHQVTLHLTDSTEALPRNPVDGEQVPVRHFGVILEPGDWRALRQRLSDAKVEFLIQPQTRFEGQVGEQSTLFLADPSGNVLEFKSFADDSAIFRA